MRARILTSVVALLAAFAGAFMALTMGSATAAPAAPQVASVAAWHPGNIVCADSRGQLFIYWQTCAPGTSWRQIPAQDVFGLNGGTYRLTAPPVTSTVTVTPTATTTAASGETAPTLAFDGATIISSSVHASVPLAWSGAVPATDKAIVGYQIQARPSFTASWATVTPVSVGVIASYRLESLDQGTLYYFRVRAVYATGDFGPYSNVINEVTAS